MIRNDRELLTGLARLNTAVAPLAMCIMNGTASVAEQHNYAQCLIAAGEWLQRRADGLAARSLTVKFLTPANLPFPRVS